MTIENSFLTIAQFVGKIGINLELFCNTNAAINLDPDVKTVISKSYALNFASIPHEMGILSQYMSGHSSFPQR